MEKALIGTGWSSIKHKSRKSNDSTQVETQGCDSTLIWLFASFYSLLKSDWSKGSAGLHRGRHWWCCRWTTGGWTADGLPDVKTFRFVLKKIKNNNPKHLESEERRVNCRWSHWCKKYKTETNGKHVNSRTDLKHTQIKHSWKCKSVKFQMPSSLFLWP